LALVGRVQLTALSHQTALILSLAQSLLLAVVTAGLLIRQAILAMLVALAVVVLEMAGVLRVALGHQGKAITAAAVALAHLTPVRAVVALLR
jgi:hypothetical protein